MTIPSTLNLEAATRPAFPFAALVGQRLLQQALLLSAIDPDIGGLLITGPRGTAKSTAARALAVLLPGVPFVTLPLAASLEQLVGTLDVEGVLVDGRLRLAPGLVARAHQGVLYVDEVNLLPDSLVDALLDVAASGVNTVERDGVSHQHAARFVLVGTMNPEEGELRPQLLDRFGLTVALDNPAEPEQRVAITRARLGFDQSPLALAAQHADEQRRLIDAVAGARAVLPRLSWSDAVLHHAAGCALAAVVDGMRADLVMLRAARALAALEGRTAVTVADVDAVAELALAHRRAPDSSAQRPRAAPDSTPPRAAQVGTPRAPGGASAGDMSRPRDSRGDARSREGDWGALPPQPESTTRVRSVGDWLPKKA